MELLLFFVCLLSVSGPVEADPEYRLIVAANNLTVEIDNELSELASSLWWSIMLCFKISLSSL